jgi:polar amino acid transport system substrate-binding protein
LKFVVTLFLSLLLSYHTLSYADQALIVSYLDNGTTRNIQGLPTTDGYRFAVDNKEKSKQEINIVTLDWPPYISRELCNKGWALQLAVAVLTSQGYDVNIRFLPWSRAVLTAEQGKADILYPEYFIENTAPSDHVNSALRHELLALSRPLPGGNIVFMKRKNDPDHFDGDINSIKNLRIGVVRGYQNFPAFDSMMDRGELNTIKAKNDLHLMKLLIGKRVDLIIGDPKVLRYTVAHSAMPEATKTKILSTAVIVQPALQYNSLYFAISKQVPHWESLRSDIDTAVQNLIRNGEIKRIIGEANQCQPTAYSHRD